MQFEETSSNDSMKLLVILIIVISLISLMAIILIIKSKRALQEQINNNENQHKEREEKNTELAFNIESLKELNIEKNNIISIAAHDLRTPLDNVEGLANLILLDSKKLKDDHVKYLEMIMDTTQKARNTITYLLDIHKIESEIEQMVLTQENFLELIEDIIKGLESMARDKNIDVILEAEHIRTSEINTDKNYFKQIISNLLTNAIKYSPANTKVVILVIETENTVRISVVDHGTGISDELKKQLFTPYSQVDQSGSGKVTGLGLIITRKLVEKLNGKFRLETVIDEGNSFSVEFFK